MPQRDPRERQRLAVLSVPAPGDTRINAALEAELRRAKAKASGLNGACASAAADCGAQCQRDMLRLESLQGSLQGEREGSPSTASGEEGDSPAAALLPAQLVVEGYL